MKLNYLTERQARILRKALEDYRSTLPSPVVYDVPEVKEEHEDIDYLLQQLERGLALQTSAKARG